MMIRPYETIYKSMPSFYKYLALILLQSTP